MTTYTSILVHIIFSTKNRAPLIEPAIRPRLLSYLAGITRNINAKPIAINGVSDHVHMLIEITPAISVADLVRTVKSNSTGWVRETFEGRQRKFAWQRGYAAFSVSRSKFQSVVRYIEQQEEHHRKQTFQEELVAFLRKNEITWDERYIWA